MEKITADRIVTINVDVQKDFQPGGSLAVTDGDLVTEVLNRVNALTREMGGTVIFTGDQHPDETPHFNTWPKHCVAGTEGAAFDENLIIEPEDIIIDKGMGQTDGYSGNEGVAKDGQTIETIVKPKDKERVIVLLGGLATDYCVRATVLDTLAIDAGEGQLTVFVLRDAIRAVNINADDEAKAITEMEAAGAIFIDSIDVLTKRAFELAA